MPRRGSKRKAKDSGFPLKNLRESRRHGWQIHRRNDAAFEPPTAPHPPLRRQPESRVFNYRRKAPSHPRSPRRHARSPLSGRPESLLSSIPHRPNIKTLDSRLKACGNDGATRRANRRAAELSAAVTVDAAKMPGAVIPAGPAPAPERGTRESRCQGWQINRFDNAAFESRTVPHSSRPQSVKRASRVFAFVRFRVAPI